MIKKVVPNVFALTKDEFDFKLKRLEFADQIHLDFMDGKFTKDASLAIEEMSEIKNYPDKVFGIHLMAYNPIECLPKMKNLNIKKVFVHFEVYESEFKLKYDLKVFKEKGFEVGIVLNPGTSVSAIVPFFKFLDSVMIMSVWPGEEHQVFIEDTLLKIPELRNAGFKKEVAFDGGIKDVNAKIIVESGADTLFVGSFVSSSDDPEKSYDLLKSIVDLD